MIGNIKENIDWKLNFRIGVAEELLQTFCEHLSRMQWICDALLQKEVGRD
jgi:hypothetical protein